MITDTIEHIDLYRNLGPNIAVAIDYLKQTNFADLAAGRYPVKGDDVYALVLEYETRDKTECELEAHKKYTDIQLMVKGIEMFGYAPLTVQHPVVDYNEAKDVAIYREEVSYQKLEAGMFMIFFPTDLHQPEVRAYEPMWVKKVVVKIRVDTTPR